MAREASNELKKLRAMKKNSIDPLVDDVADLSVSYSNALKELGPVHSRRWANALARSSEVGRDTVRNLRQEVAEAITKLQERATRTRTPATEATKADLRYMLDRGATVEACCQWILTTARGDGFSSLREVLSMIAFSDPEVYAHMEGVPTSLRTPQTWLEQQEPVIFGHEKEVMSAEQRYAVAELEEVQAMRIRLEQSIDNVEVWLSDTDTGNGAPARPPEVFDWYELADRYTAEPQPESRTADYVAYWH